MTSLTRRPLLTETWKFPGPCNIDYDFTQLRFTPGNPAHVQCDPSGSTDSMCGQGGLPGSAAASGQSDAAGE